MRKYLLMICLLICKVALAQRQSNRVITTDIDNFWIAYDKINSTKDSSKKYEYLDRYFISQGTPGLKAMMAARSYTNRSYIEAIEAYPLYWKTLRPAMFKAKSYSKEIARNVENLRILYPALRPAKIYFTVGAFRSGGTTMDSLVLIGSEIAMADHDVETREFESAVPMLATYLKTNPLSSLVFTNVHEYVHTQQKTTTAENLLGQCVLEGVAEFLAEKATGKPSSLPALNYGKNNKERIEDVFSAEMFKTSDGFWLYSNLENEFNNVRDLGYYVGYAICEAYYNKSPDKAKSIKNMIELDYNNQAELIHFAEQSGFFRKPLPELAKKYDDSRPRVIGIDPVGNNNLISSSVKKISIRFSAEMDKRNRNFELGPLGKANLLVIQKVLGFSEDGRRLDFVVELEADRHYQIVVAEGFRDLKGVSLKPYLLDFRTSK